MLSEKVMIIHLIVGYTKKISLYKISFFPEPYIHSKNKMEVELDSSNYVTKSDLKKQQALIHQSLLKRLI